MKKIILVVGFMGFIAIQSCNNEKKQVESTDTKAIDQPISQPGIVSTDSVQPAVVSNSAGATVTQSSGTATPSTTAEGMNPPHGQPNHRCDIAVGAPLNSPPGNNQQVNPVMQNSNPNPNISASPNTITPASGMQNAPVIQTTSAPGSTPPGMNPPHGQLGHDCSIAVGAPLKK